jgi:hypothetical protein
MITLKHREVSNLTQAKEQTGYGMVSTVIPKSTSDNEISERKFKNPSFPIIYSR